MDSNQLVGKWDVLKGQVKEKWGKFTNDDIMVIHGKKDQLLGKLKERYGYSEEQANREIGKFMTDCGCSSDSQPKTKKTTKH